MPEQQIEQALQETAKVIERMAAKKTRSLIDFLALNPWVEQIIPDLIKGGVIARVPVQQGERLPLQWQMVIDHTKYSLFQKVIDDFLLLSDVERREVLSTIEASPYLNPRSGFDADDVSFVYRPMLMTVNSAQPYEWRELRMFLFLALGFAELLKLLFPDATGMEGYQTLEEVMEENRKVA
jgi:hypothetical protein